MHRAGPSSRPQGPTGCRARYHGQTLQQRGIHTHAYSGTAATGDDSAVVNQLLLPPSWLLPSSLSPSHPPPAPFPRHVAVLRRGARSRLPASSSSSSSLAARALGGSQFDSLTPLPSGPSDDDQEDDEDEEEYFSCLPSSSSSSSSSPADVPARLRPKRVRFRAFADDAASRAPPPPPCPIFGGFERRSALLSPSSSSSSSSSPWLSPSLSSSSFSEQKEAPAPSSPSSPFVVVRPLLQPEIPDAASLLTDGFAAAMGYPAKYRRLLRNHIVSYLRSHTRLSPAAVVLGARFVEDGEEEEEEEEDEEEMTEEEDGEEVQDFSAGAAAADAAAAVFASSEGEEEEEEGAELLPPPPPLLHALRASGGEGAAAGAGGAAAEEGATPSPSSPPPLPGVLAGSVEVSFSASTRTRSLTLNPPDDAAYLCNMAVHPALRGRGVGRALLAAAADAARVAGAADLFLHLRLQDAGGPAGRLYSRSGFEEAGRDAGLLALFGQDRRLLLRKKL